MFKTIPHQMTVIAVSVHDFTPELIGITCGTCLEASVANNAQSIAEWLESRNQDKPCRPAIELTRRFFHNELYEHASVILDKLLEGKQAVTQLLHETPNHNFYVQVKQINKLTVR